MGGGGEEDGRPVFGNGFKWVVPVGSTVNPKHLPSIPLSKR